MEMTKMDRETLEERLRRLMRETSAADLAGGVLDYGMRGLDYAGGLTRTAAGEAADAFMPGDQVTSEDWMNALQGQAPTSSEYMQRMGLGNQGDNPDYARGAAGFAADIALDPLTYASFGVLPAVKYGSKAINPLKSALKPLGEKLYKSAFKNADKVSRNMGKTPISDIAMRNNMTGGASSLRDQLGNLAGDLGNRADDLINKSSEMGGRVDMRDVLDETFAESNHLLDRKSAGQGNEILKRVQSILSPEELSQGVDISRANQIRKNLFKELPRKTATDFGSTPAGVDFMEMVGKNFKRNIDDGFNKSRFTDGRGSLEMVGADIDALSNAGLLPAKGREAVRFMYSPDTMGAVNPTNFSRGAGLRTVGGQMVMDSSPYADILMRQGLREYNK